MADDLEPLYRTARLRALMEAAIPGPWGIAIIRYHDRTSVWLNGPDGSPIAEWKDNVGPAIEKVEENANFIKEIRDALPTLLNRSDSLAAAEREKVEIGIRVTKKIDDLRSALAAAEARVAELEAALKPFANVEPALNCWRHPDHFWDLQARWPDNEPVLRLEHFVEGGSPDEIKIVTLMPAHFRAALSSLPKAEETTAETYKPALDSWNARVTLPEAPAVADSSDYERWLGELLAVIHRDGGQYLAQHGPGKAVDDAHQVWADLMQKAEAPAPATAIDQTIAEHEALTEEWMAAAVERASASLQALHASPAPAQDADAGLIADAKLVLHDLDDDHCEAYEDTQPRSTILDYKEDRREARKMVAALATRLAELKAELAEAREKTDNYILRLMTAEKQLDDYAEQLGKIILTIPMGEMRKMGAVDGVKAMRKALTESRADMRERAAAAADEMQLYTAWDIAAAIRALPLEDKR